MARDTFSFNQKTYLTWEVYQKKKIMHPALLLSKETPNNTTLILPTAKSKQRLMEDILFNVDSEGSTLLHLAVESGNSEVTNLLMTILNSPTSERPKFND